MFFSVITVCYNAKNTIEKTITSVLKQACSSFEYIIIDGKSKDNTVNIIKNYKTIFKEKLRWISETDQGIYDAMNKAIDMAQGEYLIFINAGDELCPHILEFVQDRIKNEPHYPDLIYGDSIVVYSDGNQRAQKIRKAYPAITPKSLKKGMGIVHQSIFTNQKVFRQIGKFNTKYSIGADWDFLIRCVFNNNSMLYLEQPISIFETDGVSAQIHNWQRHQIRKDNRLYKFIDIELLKDFFNIRTMIQLITGKKVVDKCRTV